MTTDTLQRFLFPTAGVHGAVVSLRPLWLQVLNLHQTQRESAQVPASALHALGELLAATALLSSSHKTASSLTLQTHGGRSGEWPLMVSKCSIDPQWLGLCGTVDSHPHDSMVDNKAQSPRRDQHHTPLTDLADLPRHSKSAIQIMPGSSEGTDPLLLASYQTLGGAPYQAVIGLKDVHSIAAAIESYLENSVQLSSRLWLAADREAACGLLLQRLPSGEGGSQEDADEHWHRITLLAATLSTTEMLAAEPMTWLQKLFWGEEYAFYPPTPVRFFCNCHRGKVAHTLRLLGVAEFRSVLQEEGLVEVRCSFCGRRYEFTEFPDD